MTEIEKATSSIVETTLFDIGPDGGSAGGQVIFTGTVRQMLENSDGIIAEFLRKDG